MLKNILNLEGAQQLTKNEQKSIKGGVSKQCLDALAAEGCYIIGDPLNCAIQPVQHWPICGTALNICCA